MQLAIGIGIEPYLAYLLFWLQRAMSLLANYIYFFIFSLETD